MLNNSPVIFVDTRELRSPVSKKLDMLGCDLHFETLEIGDYVVSDRVAFERKTTEDFFSSLIQDRKLFSQLFDLAHSYDRPILLFEGTIEELFTTRNMNPNAVQGIINSIALMRIPMIYTLNSSGTANTIAQIARKEQFNEQRTVSLHGKRSHMKPHEQLVYSLSSIPNIGERTAHELLDHFGSIRRISRAEIDQLQECKNIGEKTAEHIHEFFRRKYYDL